jgi:hypothetical protein
MKIIDESYTHLECLQVQLTTSATATAILLHRYHAATTRIRSVILIYTVEVVMNTKKKVENLGVGAVVIGTTTISMQATCVVSVEVEIQDHNLGIIRASMSIIKI